MKMRPKSATSIDAIRNETSYNNYIYFLSLDLQPRQIDHGSTLADIIQNKQVTFRAKIKACHQSSIAILNLSLLLIML